MPVPKERTDVRITQERAILAAVYLPSSRYDERDPLGELRALAETAGATVVGEIVQHRQKPEAGTYMGVGKLEELKNLCDAVQAGVVMFDHELSPRQIANIEEIIGRKVLDRSELILDIFATRARSRESRMQVELAQLEYLLPRLKRMWSHLSRIRGGIDERFHGLLVQPSMRCAQPPSQSSDRVKPAPMPMQLAITSRGSPCRPSCIAL